MRPRVVVIVAGLVALGLTLAYALPYGTLNQATYLLDPLHRAQPELFHHDWLVGETPSYHPVFGWLTQWLYVVDPDGATAMLTTHVIITFATYAALFWLVTLIAGGWRAFVVVASFITLTRGLSMGGSYLLVGYLQPSSLATLGWVIAIAAFARGRYVVCGVAIAAAGALHVNFLVLGLGLFGLAAWCRHDLRSTDFAKLLGPPLVVLACFVPFLLAASGPSHEAVWILTDFHAPVHYSPSRLVGWIKELVAWQVGAYAALYLLAHCDRARVLWRFSVVAFVIATASALVIRFTPLTYLTQVFWARVSPFGQLACQVLIAGALVRQTMAPVPLAPRTRVLIGLAFAAPLGLYLGHIHAIVGWHAMASALVLVALALAPWPRIARAAGAAIVIATLAYAMWRSPRGVGLAAGTAGTHDELALMHWVRTSTPTDALFLAPPALYRFRLFARRAVVADTKSPPLRPDLLVQWYHRLCAMVLLPDAPTARAVNERYAELSPSELDQVAAAFGADYIVVKAPATDAAVYSNPTFAVYRR